MKTTYEYEKARAYLFCNEGLSENWENGKKVLTTLYKISEEEAEMIRNEKIVNERFDEEVISTEIIQTIDWLTETESMKLDTYEEKKKALEAMKKYICEFVNNIEPEDIWAEIGEPNE